MTTDDNGCRTEHDGRWTSEAVSLMGGAEVLDVGEHPPLYAELHCSANDSRYDLTPEYRTRWDLHIVAQLEVIRETKCLGHGNIGPRLEHHHRNRATGEDISDNQLRKDVKPNVLICNGLDYADRDRIYES